MIIRLMPHPTWTNGLIEQPHNRVHFNIQTYPNGFQTQAFINPWTIPFNILPIGADASMGQ